LKFPTVFFQNCTFSTKTSQIKAEIFLQDALLSLRDRAAGCVSFGQKWETGTGRHYFRDIIGLSSTTVT